MNKIEADKPRQAALPPPFFLFPLPPRFSGAVAGEKEGGRLALLPQSDWFFRVFRVNIDWSLVRMGKAQPATKRVD